MCLNCDSDDDYADGYCFPCWNIVTEELDRREEDELAGDGDMDTEFKTQTFEDDVDEAILALNGIIGIACRVELFGYGGIPNGMQRIKLRQVDREIGGSYSLTFGSENPRVFSIGEISNIRYVDPADGKRYEWVTPSHFVKENEGEC